MVPAQVEHIEHAERVSALSHGRLAALMVWLWLLDGVALGVCAALCIKQGPSVLLLFGFEFAILGVALCAAASRYALYAIEQRRFEGAWPAKSAYVFAIDFVAEVLRFAFYVVFFTIVFTSFFAARDMSPMDRGGAVAATWIVRGGGAVAAWIVRGDATPRPGTVGRRRYYGVPLHIVRELWSSYVNLRRRLQAYKRYRALTANMDERFPDATPEELDTAGRICIICRDTMDEGKKLPCGHVDGPRGTWGFAAVGPAPPRSAALERHSGTAIGGPCGSRRHRGR